MSDLRAALEALPRFRVRPHSDGGGMGESEDGGWVSWHEVRAALSAPTVEAELDVERLRLAMSIAGSQGPEAIAAEYARLAKP